MSHSTMNSSNKGDDGVSTVALAILVMIVTGLVFTFLGVISWVIGESFLYPAKELLGPVLNGPQQVIEPYQCSGNRYLTDEWNTIGTSSPRDRVWAVKLVFIGGWYLFGAIIALMLAVSIVVSIFTSGFWNKADTVIGRCLFAWLASGMIMAMPAIMLTGRQISQCFP